MIRRGLRRTKGRSVWTGTEPTTVDRGFTLIELLVVMVIVGILAAVAIPVFLSQQHKAYDTAAKTDLHNAALAEESYYADHGTYADIVTVQQAEGLNLSKGTTIASMYTSSTGFCLGALQRGGSPLPASQATLARLDSSITTIVWWFDSNSGGLQPANAPMGSGYNFGCPQTNYSNGATFDYQTVSG